MITRPNSNGAISLYNEWDSLPQIKGLSIWSFDDLKQGYIVMYCKWTTLIYALLVLLVKYWFRILIYALYF